MSANDNASRDVSANDNGSPWLTYEQAAAYLQLKPGTLRQMVSAAEIPVYGSSRMRRFRKDMLDLWMCNRDLAMRKWTEEKKRTW